MLHKSTTKYAFLIPEDSFTGIHPRLAYARQGNYLLDGFVGPDKGTSVDFNRLKAVQNAIFEVTERRCSMLGATNRTVMDDKVKTWDILNNEVGYLESKYTKMSIKFPNIIDTTGAAIHTKSDVAICSALKELFEKNALYLFWYGSVGLRINSKYFSNNYYYQLFIKSGYQVSVFVNRYFSPLKVVIVLVYQENGVFICGLGSHTRLTQAVEHAFEEAYLIGGYNHYYLHFNGNRDDETYLATSEKVNHVRKLKMLDMDTIETKHDSNLTIESLLQGTPNFVRKIHVFPIRQYLIPGLKCVKVFAKELYSCLPRKEYVDLEREINQCTIRISELKMKEIPECPMS